MKKNLIVLISTILLLVVSIFFIGCSSCKSRDKVREYNVIVFNNCKEPIKNFGYKTNNSSGGASYADSSLIKYGDNMKLLIMSNDFVLSVTDKNNNTFNSQQFNIDLTNKEKIYKVSVEKTENGIWEFKLEG